MTELPPNAQAIIGGYHANPFEYLGPHTDSEGRVVRAFLPTAERVAVVDDAGHESSCRACTRRACSPDR